MFDGGLMAADLRSIGPGRPSRCEAEQRRPSAMDDPVWRVLLERVAAGSRPGRREDEHMVCLAVEGGGMRAAVTAGMCVALEMSGLVPAFAASTAAPRVP